jgi:hypothetical protein
MGRSPAGMASVHVKYPICTISPLDKWWKKAQYQTVDA